MDFKVELDSTYLKGMNPHHVERAIQLAKRSFAYIRRERDLILRFNKLTQVDSDHFEQIKIITIFAIATCLELEWTSQSTLDKIALGALLQDIGLSELPDEILVLGEDAMDEDQMLAYRRHPKVGAVILANTKQVPESVKQIVYQHHEYFDGSGYPNGLAGMKVYPPARLISFAHDVVDEIFQMELPPLKALETLIRTPILASKYDPELVKGFIKCFMKPKK